MDKMKTGLIVKIVTVFILLYHPVSGAWGQSKPDTVTRYNAAVWRIGAEVAGGWVPATNRYLKGDNPVGSRVNASLSGTVRADFSYGAGTRRGMLYPGLYQGIGVSVNSFMARKLLGTPVSVYVYQGAPIRRFSDRLWLGYEWKFGAAMGWRHFDVDASPDDDNLAVVSTSVTAQLALGLRLHCALADRWVMSLGVDITHYSNGNTSWPNSGVNTAGMTLGVAYTIGAPQPRLSPDAEMVREADRRHWMYDVTLYGAVRRRVVCIDDEKILCPGRYAVAGLMVAPMYRLNRSVAVGGSLDMQWDESAALAGYHVEGSYGDGLSFYRPPFIKQLNIGVSAHAQLIMPIFTVDVGMGMNMLNPKSEKRFYQMLTLKTFVTDRIYINTGYRLGAFKKQENLMIGMGVRLH